jgi:hypothetical protein
VRQVLQVQDSAAAAIRIVADFRRREPRLSLRQPPRQLSAVVVAERVRVQARPVQQPRPKLGLGLELLEQVARQRWALRRPVNSRPVFARLV